MIVLDSNQLRFVLPGNPSLGLLSAVAGRAGHTLATTELVLAEVVRQRQDDLRAALKTLGKAEIEASRLMLKGRHQLRGLADHVTGQARKRIVRDEVAEFEARLRTEFRVLETAPEDAGRALLMEAQHVPPCENGTGSRDVTIYLTAQRAAETPELGPSGEALPLIFISEDKDFSRLRLPEQPKASEEADGSSLIIQRTVVDTLASLGYPSSDISADEVVSRPEFQQALIAAIANASIMPPRFLQQVDDAEVTVRRVAGGWARRCEGNGITLTSLAGMWSIRFVTEWMPPRPDGRPGGYKGFSMRAEGSALIVNDGQQPPDVEFSPLVLSFPGD